MQVFGAYETGRLAYWGPVSTGRAETPTPSGLFHLTWKAKSRRSTDNAEWILNWYFNFINSRGVSFHEFELPGRPASHACVRLLPRDAQWLYALGRAGRLSADQRQIVGGDDDGGPQAIERFEQGQQAARHVRVDVAGRLVGHQNLRPGDDGAGDGDALLLSARQRRGPRLPPIAKADPVQHFRDGRVDLALRHAGNAQRQRDIVIGRQVGHQPEILEDHADAAAETGQSLAGKRHHILAEQADDAATGSLGQIE